MRWFRFAVLILVATILQTGPVSIIAVIRPDIKPDLLLILLVFFAIRCKATDAVITSFTIGFASDLISPTMGLMGPQIISFGVFGIVLSELHNIVSIRRIPHEAVAIFVIGILTAVLSYLLTLLRAEVSALSVGTELLWQPLYSAIIGPFLFLPVAWWMRINGTSRRRGRRKLPPR